jgi:hypothetical protein
MCVLYDVLAAGIAKTYKALKISPLKNIPAPSEL